MSGADIKAVMLTSLRESGGVNAIGFKDNAVLRLRLPFSSTTTNANEAVVDTAFPRLELSVEVHQ